MNLKGMMATANLGGHFFLRLVKRVLFIRSPGLKEFSDYYRKDRIVSLKPSEKKLMTEAGRCISCGLCDSLCPLHPSFLPHFSRSIPDFAGVVPLEFDECAGCRGCESICPERVPIREILNFMREKSAGL